MPVTQATGLNISDELLSSTLYLLAEDFRDNLARTTALIDVHEDVHGKGQPKVEGGTRYIEPLGFGEHSNATRHQTGYEKLNLTVSDVLTPAVYSPAHTTMPIAISKDEEIKNRGESAVISILDSRTKAVMGAMRRNLLRRTVEGVDAGGYADWNTLNGLSNAVGFLEELAVNNQTNIIGGVSKATYSAIPGWQNQVADISNSFNANGLQALTDLRVETSAVSPGGEPHIWLASRQGSKNLKRSLRAYERYVDEAKLDGGRMVQMWDGIRMETEYYMPTDATVHTNGVVSFYLLNLDDIHWVFDSEGYFDVSPFEKISGEYDVRSANVRLYGQLCAKHLGSSGVAFDGETF
tara:strand:+ start:3048 stop:4100 length:1053 start_codon:yes stop_codon:yes gene_type:complete